MALVLTFVISSALAVLADVTAGCGLTAYGAWHISVSCGAHDDIIVYGELYDNEGLLDSSWNEAWGTDYVFTDTYGDGNACATWSEAEDYGVGIWYDYAEA